jgi:lysophospholipase L1-like esterase
MKNYFFSTFLCLLTLLLLGNQCMTSKNISNESNGLTYLALGDSYTIGESVAEIECYPVILASRLKEKQVNVSATRIIARTGWTTSELMSAIQNQNPPNNYDLVSLLIGVNNQYRGYDIEIYRKEFEALLKVAIQKAGGNKKRVFVISIPDYGVTPFAKNSDIGKIAQEIDAYNLINREISLQYGITYFDITPTSRKATQDLSLIAEDGLHPSGKMYAEWVELMLEEVANVLK